MLRRAVDRADYLITFARLSAVDWIAGPIPETPTDYAIPESGSGFRKALASKIAVLTRAATRAFCGFPLLSLLLRDHRGSIAVEFAILIPVQALLIFGGIDLALAMLTEQRLNFATEAAARCGTVKDSPCSSPSATSAWAAEQAGVPNISSGNFVVTFNAACGGVSVLATYSYSGFILPTIGLGAAACYVPEKAS